jgi:phosphoribosylformylglycinamidine synthase
LCEAGLVPGALMHNDERKFICKNVFIKAQTNDVLITSGIPLEKALKIPIAHGEGKYYADEETLKVMNQNGQIIFRYCDKDGMLTNEANPNGATENIAGVCNMNKNVFGMMPHPERAMDSILSNIEGQYIFESILRLAKA